MTFARFRPTDFTSTHRSPGSSEVVRGESSRGTRCARSRGRIIIVGWATATIVFCTGAVEKGKRLLGLRALR